MAKWENEKSSVDNLSKIREKIEDINNQIQVAERNYDLETVAKLKYGELPALNKNLEQEEEK